MRARGPGAGGEAGETCDGGVYPLVVCGRGRYHCTMLTDHYGNPLGTTSDAARAAYSEAMMAYLDALPGVDAAADRALAADEGFALAHVLKARNAQVYGRMEAARAAMAEARATVAGAPAQVAAQVAIFDDLIHGRTAEVYAKVRAHLLDYPRDAMVAQTCLGVFSLIGFSGRMGREAEHLSVAEQLAPAYGEDGWFLAQLAFAQLEVGQLDQAERNIEAAMAQNPGSAHAAHIRAHLHYEAGETQAGRAFLTGWMAGYDRAGMMHCHNSWHLALWALAMGDEAEMWRIAAEDLDPDRTDAPPLNILTDLASLFWRAEMAGLEVPPEEWRRLSDYAARAFPRPQLGFADVHAALAHAVAGQPERLLGIAEGAKGPAADVVAPCAAAFGALARADWTEAEAQLIPVLGAHERIGGSRAQRDLIDLTFLHVLIRQGRAGEARRLLAIRRPRADSAGAVAGLASQV